MLATFDAIPIVSFVTSVPRPDDFLSCFLDIAILRYLANSEDAKCVLNVSQTRPQFSFMHNQQYIHFLLSLQRVNFRCLALFRTSLSDASCPLLKDKLLSALGDSAPRLRRVQRRIAASVLRQQSVEPLGEFAPSAGAARRGQPLPLLPPHVAPAQFLAELFGAVTFLRPPNQRAH